MGDNTSIQIKKDTKLKLDSLKISKRDTYNDIIENLLEDSYELNKETMEDIQKAIGEYKKGKSHSLEEVKNQLGF